MDNLTSQQDMARVVIESPNVVCSCGSKVFVPAAVLKKVSSLYTGTGKEGIQDIPIYVCAKCGEIPDEIKKNANFSKIIGEEEKIKIS